ncbi:hypothetical protein EVAR_86038_1 [Eumeta japonica]|uniref:Uncharacterized protein n=1 Tax=Eumeta variegata TaxID=151549 RepID=A0A4C1UKN5_EUMVA|nr:hypothetical protein EVAR_86038_1 [Eumeta japonica]
MARLRIKNAKKDLNGVYRRTPVAGKWLISMKTAIEESDIWLGAGRGALVYTLFIAVGPLKPKESKPTAQRRFASRRGTKPRRLFTAQTSPSAPRYVTEYSSNSMHITRYQRSQLRMGTVSAGGTAPPLTAKPGPAS